MFQKTNTRIKIARSAQTVSWERRNGAACPVSGGEWKDEQGVCLEAEYSRCKGERLSDLLRAWSRGQHGHFLPIMEELPGLDDIEGAAEQAERLA